MYTLVYRSEIESYLGDIDISSMIYAARESNAAHKITGIFLHINGKIIQLLEGEEVVVKKLYEIIGRDRRHKNLKILLEKEIDTRQFDGWDMGFKNITKDKLNEYPVLKSCLEDDTSDNSDSLYNFLIELNCEQECQDAFY